MWSEVMTLTSWTGGGARQALPPGHDSPLRSEINHLVARGDSGRARSRQIAIGPSELGGECDRRLAMRLAGVRRGNVRADPWAAIVGTAIHSAMEEFLQADNRRELAAGRPARWLTERRVWVDRFVCGSSDAFHLPTATVVDWKTYGPAAAERLEAGGPSESYRIQAQLYGLGYANAGFSVRAVALVFLPRAGRLRDMAYFEWPYDPDMARSALARMHRLAKDVVGLQTKLGRQDVWERIPCTPSGLCGWCPYFSREANENTPGSCPGRKQEG